MGWWNSRTEKVEMVARCKARKRQMKHFVRARQAFSDAHSMYLMSLKNTSSALLQFVTEEAKLHLPLSPPSPPQIGHSNIPQPPPPPPPVASSVWDFFDPFDWTKLKEEWDYTNVTSEVSINTTITTTNISDELDLVVSTKSKGIEETIREIDEFFIKAVSSGGPPSLLLDYPTSTKLDQSTPGKLHIAKWNAFGKFCDQPNELLNVDGFVSSHGSTVERFYALEKRLYLEVKNAETLKLDHENKSDQLKKLELKKVDNIKTVTTKKELEKLEMRMVVASQTIESTSAEVKKLRESDLYPQLKELVKSLVCMWRSMYECHHEQTNIIQQFKYLNTTPSNEPTSEIHRQSALQLKIQVQQWHFSFNNIVKAQRDYVHSLSSWLRLSLFQVGNNPKKSSPDSLMYSLCQEWQLAVDNAPDKLASEGINSLYTVIHAIVLQHEVEFKQKKKSEETLRQLQRKNAQLQEMESKHGPPQIPDPLGGNRNPLGKKREKVEALRAKAEEEKTRYEKSLNVTRSMTVKNLQMGLLHVFQSLTSFAYEYTYGFESAYDQRINDGA